jgi:hypothetical protein
MSSPEYAKHFEYAEAAVNFMRTAGVEFAAALTLDEIESAEAEFEVSFPPDLRAFLTTALPVGEGFPNWRQTAAAQIRERLEWPRDGILFDVAHNSFWPDELGDRPDDDVEARRQVGAWVDAAPRLLPVYSHRYIPSVPDEPGNPIFSVYQTDTIYYGMNLPDYLNKEFGVRNPYEVPDEPRRIEFWSDLVDFNNA